MIIGTMTPKQVLSACMHAAERYEMVLEFRSEQDAIDATEELRDVGITCGRDGKAVHVGGQHLQVMP